MNPLCSRNDVRNWNQLKPACRRPYSAMLSFRTYCFYAFVRACNEKGFSCAHYSKNEVVSLYTVLRLEDFGNTHSSSRIGVSTICVHVRG